MLMLDGATWIRFAVWMIIGKLQIKFCDSIAKLSKQSSGFIIYFVYGIWQSEENTSKQGRRSVIYAHTNLAFEEDDETKKRKRSD
jgi:hypothetical protein